MKKIFGHKQVALGAALLLPLTASISTARADYTVHIDENDRRGTWEGWGTSLAWRAHVVGGKKYQDLYVDLFFSPKTVPFAGAALPGMGLNIIRYNVGGGGRGETYAGVKEQVPEQLRWERDIDGFWINWGSCKPDSSSWDWERDAGQVAFARAAMARGVDHIEMFSNAPMWWMNDSRSSAGGNLQSQHNRDFAFYLATVAKQARQRWGIKVDAIEPFNEPSAGWWNYPKNQEGANIPREQQKAVIGMLREELDKQSLRKTRISASDENTMEQALKTHEYFKTQTVEVRGKKRVVADLIDRVNVHSYNGLAHWRDNTARQKLR